MMPLTREETALNVLLTPILKEVYAQQVTLVQWGKRREVLAALLRQFQSFAERDSTFKILFKKYLFTGSAYEGLQVKEVDEFDIDLVLSLPSCFNGKFMIAEPNSPPSFGYLRLKEPFETIISRDSNKTQLTKLSQFFDGNGFLLNDKIRSWVQSLVDQFVISGNARLVQGITHVSPTNSGPARTLIVHLRNDPIHNISVDLVPVFAVRCQGHLNNIPRVQMVPKQLMDECILVPKPLRNSHLYQVPDSVRPLLWRFHFPSAENSLMENRGYLKPLIKLIKSLRDVQGWRLPSYFIKQIAFKMVKEHPYEHYFAEGVQGIRFMQMLESLRDHFEKGHLGHIFYPGFNLFERMSREELIQLHNRLKKIIDAIKRDPQTLKPLFKCSKHT